MIRFSCTNCERVYFLADALAHLPLLCKGCGHRLEVPDAQSEPSEVKAEPKLLEPPPPVPASLPKTREPEESDDPPENSRKVQAIIADVVVALILLAIGMFVGEAIAGKSTGAILNGAGSSPKFPPTDLLLWLGSVGFFGLVYGWLGTRGWTVGGWLKRR